MTLQKTTELLYHKLLAMVRLRLALTDSFHSNEGNSNSAFTMPASTVWGDRKVSTHLLKRDPYSTRSVRVLSAPIDTTRHQQDNRSSVYQLPHQPYPNNLCFLLQELHSSSGLGTQSWPELCCRCICFHACSWAVISLSWSDLGPDLFFAWGWLDCWWNLLLSPALSCLPSWCTVGLCLLVRMLPLPVLWSPSAAGLPFLVEQPCSCCSLKQ